MQFDFVGTLYKYGIYAAMIMGALILAYLAGIRLRKKDKLEAPTYERIDSGIVVSDPDDEDDP